ncbi:MAG: hypothetical protein WCP33_07025, partial [Deltaproteobacteria bacterium]
MPTLHMKNSKGEVGRSHLLVFCVIVALIGVAGYGYFINLKQSITREKQNELVIIADMKAREIVNWRKERLGDAETVYSNALLAARLREYLNGSAPRTVLDECRNWMESLRRSYGYRGVFL